ncbi:DUF2807 domain-containing protein [Gillisia sp. M10.2A]|uniref:DUF2807 domain-containing protein n=1 Tax=Gillisia lutea TaxID=2909668 RepID=A0ABS9EF91_9FLAO|nr:DUF2807 domain-containing protein [Gillisia lutea]MCF4101543.1 DUF2807 domain-containing protein [Gillisia lutea]
MIIKKTTQIKIVLVTAMLISSIGYAQKRDKIKGNKEVVSVSEKIDKGFNKLEVNDNFELTLSQGNDNNYILTTDKNLVDVIQFHVKDSTLIISSSSEIQSSKRLEIFLTVENLQSMIFRDDVKVIGRGVFTSDTLNIEGFNSSRFILDINATTINIAMQKNSDGDLKIKSTNLNVIMNDRTDLDTYITAENIGVTLNDSAQFKAEGEAEISNFDLKDGAELKAKELRVGTVILNTSNSSDVYVNATNTLELYAEGKSNVYVYGNPKMDIKGFSEKSKIIKK